MKGAAFVTVYLEKPEGLYSFNIPFGTKYELALTACQEILDQLKELKSMEDARQEECNKSVTPEVVA